MHNLKEQVDRLEAALAEANKRIEHLERVIDHVVIAKPAESKKRSR